VKVSKFCKDCQRAKPSPRPKVIPVPPQSSTLCAAPFNVRDAEAADAPPSLPEDLLAAKFVYMKSPLYLPALSALQPYAVHKQAEKFVHQSRYDAVSDVHLKPHLCGSVTPALLLKIGQPPETGILVRFYRDNCKYVLTPRGLCRIAKSCEFTLCHIAWSQPEKFDLNFTLSGIEQSRQ
jgi:hypothetical protein